MPLHTRPNQEAFEWDATDSWAQDFGDKSSGHTTQPARRRTVTFALPASTRQKPAVLFVDGRNQVRSVIAHAQAEIARLWTLNQRGYNLFSAIDSAGLHVDSSLTRKGSWQNSIGDEPADIAALEAALGQPGRTEGQELKRRFEHKHSTRGLEYEDFDRFDYILAFDSRTLTDLRNLEWVAYHRARRLGRDGLRAKTRYIGDYNPHHRGAVTIPKPTTDRIPRRRDYEGTVRLIERELHNFLHTVLNWTKPQRITLDAMTSRYRSRQFLAKATQVTDAKLRTLRLLHENRVMVDENMVMGRNRLVTVTGKEGSQLREALEDARASFL